MPLFRVKEQRCYVDTHIIEAVDEDHARRLQGEIVDGEPEDSWSDAILSVEEVENESAATREP